MLSSNIRPPSTTHKNIHLGKHLQRHPSAFCVRVRELASKGHTTRWRKIVLFVTGISLPDASQPANMTDTTPTDMHQRRPRHRVETDRASVWASFNMLVFQDIQGILSTINFERKKIGLMMWIVCFYTVAAESFCW